MLLGIDTGGTYTDAVLLDEDKPGSDGVIASAKSLTTRHNLSVGIGKAVDAVLEKAGVAGKDIALVSMSTTLATNAIVEGQGGRVCLISVGFEAADLERSGLQHAVGGDPVVMISGGHGPHGREKEPLATGSLEAVVNEHKDSVVGFAVAAQFAVRNNAHELAVKEFIESRCDRPVTMSHELTSKLGGPKRALTCILNARLIGLLSSLIDACDELLTARAIDAPMMVVRGDGALVSADVARRHPIETILSGPAASLVGAAWLTDSSDAIVSDIGGTTTDIAVLRDGRPKIDPEGAMVGGMRTMVEAAAIDTHGLGGDSEVGIETGGFNPQITLGPRRSIPLSLLARDHEALVMDILRLQLDADVIKETFGRFAVASPAAHHAKGGHSDNEEIILDALQKGPQPVDQLLKSRMFTSALKRLRSRGLLMISSLTPSDTAHVLGLHDAWHRDAAVLGAQLFARKRNGRGDPIAEDGTEISRRVLARLHRRSAEVILNTAFADDGFGQISPATDFLSRSALNRHSGLIKPRLDLTVPVIGLGASAPTYYPAIADLLNAPCQIPEFSGVANAIGAVVGRVRITKTATVTDIGAGLFRVHLDQGNSDFQDAEEAVTFGLDELEKYARQEAIEAGAADISVRRSADRMVATIEGRESLIEATLTATATGRPRAARDV